MCSEWGCQSKNVTGNRGWKQSLAHVGSPRTTRAAAWPGRMNPGRGRVYHADACNHQNRPAQPQTMAGSAPILPR
ncbi:Unknown protein sequence [Pseudomonas amygdali pv. myricae]|nr:hypothetical protein AC519_4481 [Pseudomonas savastanoi]KPB56219.1 Unknown protein sequence [Pseudomonas amygdali pv. myricae]